MLQSNDPEHQGVVDFAMALAAATKNYTLYPPGHSIAQKHLLHTSHLLSQFLGRYNRLRLDVNTTTLLYDGEVIYRGDAEESDIAYLLGRDGVKYLEFIKGIEQWELKDLLTLINSYRIQTGEQDGDIVTALWEKEYPHILYEAIDILSLDSPTINFSGFRVTPGARSSDREDSFPAAADSPAGDKTVAETDAAAPLSPANRYEYSDLDEEGPSHDSINDVPPVSIALTAKENDLWALSLSERYQLEQMVTAAEKEDNTNDVIDLLLITLVLLNDRHNFEQTLDFLLDRLIRTLKLHHFHSALKVLKNLHNIQQTCGAKKQWTLPLLNTFFKTLAQPESLRELEQFILNPPKKTLSAQQEYLQAFLCLLPPTILTTLAPLSVQATDSKALLLNVIKHHGQQNPKCLADVIHLLDEEVCFKLMPLAEWMKTVDGTLVFSKMALHPSRNVSRKGFEILVRRDTLEPKRLFPLIHDPDEEIRKKIFTLLGRRRDKQIEKRLLGHLKKGADYRDDKHHISSCYRALGQCGSMLSIPFLKDVLLKKRWDNLLSFEGLMHKQGAAHALAGLQLSEADDILTEGAKSLRPDIRHACRKALGK